MDLDMTEINNLLVKENKTEDTDTMDYFLLKLIRIHDTL